MKRILALCRRGEKTQRPGMKLALTALVLLLFISLAACNWELNVYRVLATTQAGYETYFRSVVELHDAGLVTDASYARAKGISERIYALGKNTTALMVSYQQIKTAEGKAKISAAVLELPRLVAELAGIASAFGKTSGVVPPAALVIEFENHTRPKLERMEADLALVEALQ